MSLWTVCGLFLAIAIVVATAGCGLFQAAEVSTLKIDGMWCATCEAPVKNAAGTVDGVIRADVSYKDGTAVVSYDPTKTSPEAIAQAINEISRFRAELATRTP